MKTLTAEISIKYDLINDIPIVKSKTISVIEFPFERKKILDRLEQLPVLDEKKYSEDIMHLRNMIGKYLSTNLTNIQYAIKNINIVKLHQNKIIEITRDSFFTKVNFQCYFGEDNSRFEDCLYFTDLVKNEDILEIIKKRWSFVANRTVIVDHITPFNNKYILIAPVVTSLLLTLVKRFNEQLYSRLKKSKHLENASIEDYSGLFLYHIENEQAIDINNGHGIIVANTALLFHGKMVDGKSVKLEINLNELTLLNVRMVVYFDSIYIMTMPNRFLNFV